MISRLYFLKIIGFLCIAFSITLIPPMMVSTYYHDGELFDFIITFLSLISIGLLFWLPLKNTVINLRHRDGFLIVAIFWLLLSFISSLPFMIGPSQLNIVDSIFESVSGFTTTGATIINDLDKMTPSILYYRQQLQWFGGLGLIVIAMAVVPLLGVGGTQIYRAETPGPMKNEKITPRLVQTAHYLGTIYIVLTISCALSYWIAGLTPLDALEHSFSTVSTGGFSSHNDSLAYYHSQSVNYVAIVFMLLGGINFSIHFLAIHKRNLSIYMVDDEVRTYLLLTAGLVFIFTIFLYVMNVYTNIYDAFETSLFEIVSVITSTGLGLTDFSVWPLFLPVFLIFVSFIGGCGGSTAGGIKVMRVMVLFKQAGQQFFNLVHPKAIRPVRIGNRVLDKKTMQGIWAFFSVYLVAFVVLTLLMSLAGLDQVSAFSAVASCINNLGPGLGEVSTTFSGVSDFAKMIAVAAMLLGRLEIFTLLVIFSPAYWRG